MGGADMTQTDPTAGDGLAALKVAARKAASSARKNAREVAGPGASERLAAYVVDALSPQPGSFVSGFLPIGSEIDPRPALRRLREAGCRICLPCVVAPASPLVFRVWEEDDPLVTEEFGTRAPAPEAEAVDPDILLVPMLAFDSDGFRLGYGGGFYDRSLEALRQRKRVIAAGIAYDGQRAESVPLGPHDEPLDWVITDKAAYRAGEAGA